MGNLGSYQAMTSLAKKVGGPVALAAVTAASGFLVGRAAEVGFKRAGNSWVARIKKVVSARESSETFTVGTEADCGAGLTLHAGDEFRVLERDGESMLIEVLGNADNPYVVSAEILARVSDFPA